MSTAGWSWPFVCSNCRRPYAPEGFPHVCPACGGLYDVDRPLEHSLDPDPTARGLARFRPGFALPPGAGLITLGEGSTPLVAAAAAGGTIHFKCEHLNPTGSFKDRAAALIVSALIACGVREVIEDSSGNAGAALAAYGARAGITVRVFVPSQAAGPKRAQMEAYGAQIVEVPGPRQAAAEAAREEAAAGAVYASHAHLPHGLAGMATIAYEIVEQLGGPPASVVVPVGQGSLALGLHAGFEALRRAGRIGTAPALFGVQARACAPLWAVHQAGAAGLGFVLEGPTVAEGIRIRHPLRGDAVLRAIEGSGGGLVAVDEPEILAGRDALARLGLYVEPTSAVIWPALEALRARLRPPVVAVLTGSGLKAPG